MSIRDWHKIMISTKGRFTSQDKITECVIWCRKEFGTMWEAGTNRTGRWCCFWDGHINDHSHYRFHFRDETDATLFALRWSS